MQDLVVTDHIMTCQVTFVLGKVVGMFLMQAKMPGSRVRVKGWLLHWREGSGRASSSCGWEVPEVGRH
jgi:hypothetical protein